MFKNLKDKIATQVTKTNQTLFSTIMSNDSEDNRSRLNSTSSDISQITNYVSPTRQFIPPSDIESEYGGDESDHETNNRIQKLLSVYKNKFTQLKKAYDEVEHEKDHLKDVLQKCQDTSIKRQTQSREQIKHYQQIKEQLEQEIKLRDNQIEEFTRQLSIQQDSAQSEHEEVENLLERNTKLVTLFIQYKKAIHTHQEKQADLTKQRDDLLQQLSEKQTFIESMMKDRHLEDPSLEVKEHFDSDISVLLFDKERLQKQLAVAHVCLQLLEADLKSSKQQFNEEIKREQDKFKKKSEDLLNLEILNKEFQETILNNKQQIELLKQNLSTENEQHIKSFDALKTEYENLTNELHQTKQAKDNIQSLLDQTMYKDKSEPPDEQFT